MVLADLIKSTKTNLDKIMKLVPDSFDVPKTLTMPGFIIRPLQVSDAELDYEAVMSSINIINQTRGGDDTWPLPSMTLEQDREDLQWHEEEFKNRTSFTYTVMSPDEKECLGCVYFYPPGFRGEASKNADVDVSFWVTQKAYDMGMYGKLHEAIDAWLRAEWPFKVIVYTNIEMRKV